MKKFSIFILLVALFGVLQSCKKEELGTQYSITGQWIGTYNIEQAAESGDSFYYSYFIRKDDSIQVHSQGADGNTYYGIGTWSLKDSLFNAEITTTNFSQQGQVQLVSAIFDKKKGQLRDGRVESVGGFFLASFNLQKAD